MAEKVCRDCGAPEVYLFGRCSECDFQESQQYFECRRGHSFCHRH